LCPSICTARTATVISGISGHFIPEGGAKLSYIHHIRRVAIELVILSSYLTEVSDKITFLVKKFPERKYDIPADELIINDNP